MDAFERQPVIADQDDIVDNGEQDGQDDASRGNLGQAHADIREAVFADFPIEKIDRTLEEAADKDGAQGAQQSFQSE